MKNVSIIIPVIRPEKAKRCVEAIESYGFDGEIITAEDNNRIGCPWMVKQLTSAASGDIVCFFGDDTIPREGWLEAGLDKMAQLPDGWGVVGLRTSPNSEKAHWIADKRMLELTGGEFFSTDYKHCFCDDELRDIALENDKWAVTDEVVIDHDHPVNGSEEDSDYNRVYSNEYFNEDRKTYYRRKRERIGGLAIGFPLVDENIPVQFFLSYECMEKAQRYTLLTPKFPHGPWTGSIADARNSLVEQARKEGAKYLLMMDTDQVYPPDTFPKLLSHNVDICGVKVHRRYIPFDPIFYRGEIGKYKNVPDEEAYSGKLIEVDATGTGCLLINMEIFDELPYPWFEFGMHEGKPVGEDINFCSLAKKHGFRIFVDTSIEVGHLTTIEVGKMMHKWCRLIETKTKNKELENHE